MTEAIANHTALGSALILSAELLILVFLCVFFAKSRRKALYSYILRMNPLC